MPKNSESFKMPGNGKIIEIIGKLRFLENTWESAEFSRNSKNANKSGIPKNPLKIPNNPLKSLKILGILHKLQK